MKRFTRPTLGVERLESRECPALALRYTAAGLFLTGTPSSNLTITGQASGQFKVMDGAKNLGSYRLAGGGLDIRLRSRPGSIDLDLAGKVIGGNVYIDLGNGFTGNPLTKVSAVDIFDSTAVAALGTGVIRGSLTVVRGNGGETVQVGANQTTLVNTDINPVTVRGNAAYGARVGLNKIDTFVIGDASVIGGGVALSRVERATIGLNGAAAIAGVTRIGRNVAIHYTGASIGLQYTLQGRVGGDVTVKAGATATSGANSFLVEPADAANDTILGGDVTVTFGHALNGNSFLLLDPTADPSSTIIEDDVNFRSLNGLATPAVDRVAVEGAILGNLAVLLGDGDNEFSFGDAAATVAFVNGDLTYVGGDGTNKIGVMGAVLMNYFNGTLGGDLTIVMGDGTNDTQVSTTVNGVFTYVGGDGFDTVTIFPEVNQDYAYLLDILFGSGTNVLTLDATNVVGGNIMAIAGIVEAPLGAVSNTINFIDPNGTLDTTALMQFNFP